MNSWNEHHGVLSCIHTNYKLYNYDHVKSWWRSAMLANLAYILNMAFPSVLREQSTTSQGVSCHYLNRRLTKETLVTKYMVFLTLIWQYQCLLFCMLVMYNCFSSVQLQYSSFINSHSICWSRQKKKNICQHLTYIKDIKSKPNLSAEGKNLALWKGNYREQLFYNTPKWVLRCQVQHCLLEFCSTAPSVNPF